MNDFATFELVARLHARTDDLDAKDAADLILWFLDQQATMLDSLRTGDRYVIRKDPETGLGVIYTGPEMILNIVRVSDTGARALP